ncbi:unnamed protein product [Pleuronectes platessa]|uniref:Uncharacterized protein n=1 Tax=Pleuronectes platessa TaxID=8262 RepID=A0A9N7UEL2_PLEPL|nr:unnamed protein product [Pleuronectes platessa]
MSSGVGGDQSRAEEQQRGLSTPLDSCVRLSHAIAAAQPWSSPLIAGPSRVEVPDTFLHLRVPLTVYMLLEKAPRRLLTDHSRSSDHRAHVLGLERRGRVYQTHQLHNNGASLFQEDVEYSENASFQPGEELPDNLDGTDKASCKVSSMSGNKRRSRVEGDVQNWGTEYLLSTKSALPMSLDLDLDLDLDHALFTGV